MYACVCGHLPVCVCVDICLCVRATVCLSVCCVFMRLREHLCVYTQTDVHHYLLNMRGFFLLPVKHGMH